MFDRLSDAMLKPLTWVAAPAGSGKTTVVTSYLDKSNIPCLWYQVDEGDADAANFFYYMGIAVNGLAGKQKPLPVLTPEYLETLSIFTRRYFEELFSRIKPPFTIVFDNYQDVPETARFHEIINTGLSVIPEGIKIICISRVAPHSEFARIRANSMMGRIGWEDLQFSIDETEGVLHTGKKRKYSSEHISTLQRITDGWVAGIVLLSEDTEIENFAPREDNIGSLGVFDYFATEVFKRVDDDTRALLIKTAFLPNVDPKTAEELTGIKTAGKILSSLSRENFFTTNYRQKSLYQYHPLFREFLQAQARRLLSDQQILEVKKNAATLLREAGRYEDAVDIFISIDEWASASELIQNHAEGLLSQGRSETVRGWLDSLPPQRVEDAPYLLYWKGVCYSSVNPIEGIVLFERAFRLFMAQGDRMGMFLAWCASADLCLHSMEYGHIEGWVANLNNLLLADNTFPSPEMEAKVTMSMFNALSLRLPDHPDMEAWTEKVFSIIHLRDDIDINLRLLAGIYLLVYSTWLGKLGRAKAVMDLFEKTSMKGISGLVQTTIKTGEALYYMVTSSKELCLRKVDEELRIAEETGVHVWDSHIIMHGMASALSEEDGKAFEMLSKKMPTESKFARRMDQGYYHIISSWKALLEGNKVVAEHHARLAMDIMTIIGFTQGQTICMFSLSEILYENGKITEAESQLSKALEIACSMRSGIFEYHCYLIKSRIAFGCGDNDEGLDCLRKAMSLASEGGYVNMHWWRRDVMLGHCMRAIDAGIEVEFVKRLIKKRGLAPAEPPIHQEEWPWPLKIYTLGCFEIRKDDVPLVFSGKTPQMPLLLLKALIVHGGAGVHEASLADILWPDADGDAAHNTFKITLHRLRQLLGVEGAVFLKEGKVGLDPARVWVDTWAFQALCAKADEHINNGSSSPDDMIVQKAIRLYNGHFIQGDSYDWAIATRENLRSNFVKLIFKASERMESFGNYEAAISLYEKGLEADDLIEEFYQRLMVCNDRIGRRSEAVRLYNKCVEKIKKGLGLAPSSKTQAIYRTLL